MKFRGYDKISGKLTIPNRSKSAVRRMSDRNGTRFNSTIEEQSLDVVWRYGIAAWLIIGFLVTIIGDTLILIGIRKRTSQTLTVDLLVQLLVCDILVAVFLFPVAMTSAIAQAWLFGETFCTFQGVLIQILLTESNLLRLLLAIERFSFAVKCRGMKITTGTGRAISFVFLCISILNAVFTINIEDNYTYMSGFYSCKLGGSLLPIALNIAISVVPSVIISIVSTCSLKNMPVFKTALVHPASLNARPSLYPGSFTDNRQERVWTTTGPVILGCNLATEPPAMSTLSVGEMRTTEVLALLNLSVMVTYFIRFSVTFTSYLYPGNIYFQVIILSLYVISFAIQPIILFCSSPTLRINIQYMLKLKESRNKNLPRPNRKKTVVVLVPREKSTDMPTFLQAPSEMQIHVKVNHIDKTDSLDADSQSDISTVDANDRHCNTKEPNESVVSLRVRVGSSLDERSLYCESLSGIDFTLPNSVSGCNTLYKSQPFYEITESPNDQACHFLSKTTRPDRHSSGRINKALRTYQYVNAHQS